MQQIKKWSCVQHEAKVSRAVVDERDRASQPCCLFGDSHSCLSAGHTEPGGMLQAKIQVGSRPHPQGFVRVQQQQHLRQKHSVKTAHVFAPHGLAFNFTVERVS